ncbi:DUF3054 domain-containing protein [Corynebacterium oculi]|uniref:DUF3054 domain-containing protein n=1 Tax=Corynebacterium oculi TaxID=1544416 RepID=A0A0Q0YBH8_9CORY|nr:DUF3054 domain-containing protein [Corynebacterium oculi]KQB83335.1 hypothetical protein Cocul_02310 [Corynebacterium oculi]
MFPSTAARWFTYDALAIALFALLARVAHRSEDMPLSVTGWLSTLWPFLLGVALAWGILAVRGGVTPSPWRSLGLAWPLAVIVGLGVWGLRHGAVPHWSFIIVATVTSGVLMAAWRAVAGRTSTGQ